MAFVFSWVEILIKLFAVFGSACFWVTNLLRSDRKKIELRQKNGSHKHIVLFILI